MTMTPEKPGRKFRLKSVELGTEGESDGWFVVTNFEWRVLDEQTGEVVLRIPYSHTRDNTEWPERDYWTGPQKVDIVGHEVRAYQTRSARVGFSFEGQEDPVVGYDVYPLPG